MTPSEELLDALLHGLVYAGVIITIFMTTTAWAIWFERKFAGRMQSRLGPTMVGPKGLLQPLADALKLLQKEDIVPTKADRFLFNIAPPLAAFFALAVAAVIPFGPQHIAADLDIGILWILAFSGLMVFPVWVGGWASANKYALIGAMRAVAQGVSYEIPLVLSAMVPVVLTGELSLSGMVDFQVTHGWLVFWPPGPGILAFLIFFLSSLAEANRIPFDIPEAESELVAGVTTEYTGMKFGLFYMAEYLHTLIASAVAAAVFFGGWDMYGFNEIEVGGWIIKLGIMWMVLKTLALFFVVTWVRWSFLRFRADQLMDLCWRRLLPTSLVLIMAAAFWVHWQQPSSEVSLDAGVEVAAPAAMGGE